MLVRMADLCSAVAGIASSLVSAASVYGAQLGNYPSFFLPDLADSFDNLHIQGVDAPAHAAMDHIGLSQFWPPDFRRFHLPKF